tara:strand:+ start:586 stop:882 length:297 start_codon:yes stop_codon:yes gene_type:complete
MSTYNTQHHMTTYNGWANYETWNASLWINNDQLLYEIAKACVNKSRLGMVDNPWQHFISLMTDPILNNILSKTEDGVSWNDEKINAEEMTDMMEELVS